MRNAFLVFPSFLALAGALGGCATLHRAQLDEIDATRGRLVPFEIHASSLGVDVKAAGRTASLLTHSRQPSKVASILAAFTYGPKTGDITFDDTYADEIAEKILERCPSARVTGLMSLRESTKYDAISSEYATIRGFCIEE